MRRGAGAPHRAAPREFPHLVGPVATAMAGDIEVVVPLEGLVDPAAERAKLVKERAKLEKDRDHMKRKLADPNFTSRAPIEVLDKDRARLAEHRGRDSPRSSWRSARLKGGKS